MKGQEVIVSAGALNMVIMALRRDAAKGMQVRAEMADELEKTILAGEVERLRAQVQLLTRERDSARLGRDAFFAEMMKATSNVNVLKAALRATGMPQTLLEKMLAESANQVERCTSCDGTGDVVDRIGEWRGHCLCEAGQALTSERRERLGAACAKVFDWKEQSDDERYQRLERERMGDPDLKTGIYAPRPNGMKCSVCSLPQFNTPSGPSCDNGHGGAEGAPE